MTRHLLLLLVVLTLPMLAQSKPPELQVRADMNLFKLPAGVYFGECVGVALDSKGNIYVANRGLHPLMEFRPDGAFMRFLGEGLDIYEAPHTVVIDGQDNIWYAHAGTTLIVELDQHQQLLMVFAITPEAWTLATRMVQHGQPGASSSDQPTRAVSG